MPYDARSRLSELIDNDRFLFMLKAPSEKYYIRKNICSILKYNVNKKNINKLLI